MKLSLTPGGVLALCLVLGASADKMIQRVSEHTIEDGAQRSLRGTGDVPAIEGFARRPEERYLQSSNCGCSACTVAIWNTYAGTYQCGARIEWMADPNGGGLSDEDACRYVSDEYPAICGPACHPDRCDGAPPPAPARCGCSSCTDAVWNHAAGGSHSCGDRIEWLQTDEGGSLSAPDACRYVSDEYPNDECGPMCHPDLCDAEPTASPTVPTRCGCSTCTDAVWNHAAGGSHSCGARIEWLQTSDGNSMSAPDACRYVSNEYPNGECGPMCHPDLCDAETDQPTPNPSKAPTPNPSEAPTPNPSRAPTWSPTMKPTTSRPSASPTSKPTISPTNEPTKEPSVSPTMKPTTSEPSTSPTSKPTDNPTEEPTGEPSVSPTMKPTTARPSVSPTSKPTTSPTKGPTKEPSVSPTMKPTTSEPSVSPTSKPTDNPTPLPTLAPTGSPTSKPVAPTTPAPTVQPDPDHCDCFSCTEAIWTTYAGTYQCGARIEYMANPFGGGLSSEDACRYVSNEYPTICGPSCHPDHCDTADAPTTPPTPTPAKCGCSSCVDTVWSHAAGGSHSCGARIEYMADANGGGLSYEDACRYVSNEYPLGECGPMCHPDLCDSCPLYPNGSYVAPTDLPPSPPIQTADDLYCFPSYPSRERYTNVFAGSYSIEVKDGQGDLCGPGDNVFSSDTVSYDAAAQELTMEYKQIGGSWTSSEVRILLPESQGLTFSYGTFDFSLKSLSVLDENDNIISTVLPSDLVIGLFTWDISDDYEAHENWNHEVDVEISQWGNPANAQDVQFLVQPHHPGGPHFPQRLSSGGPGTGPADFDQGGHTYGFTWEPNRISWSTSAGGGQSRLYSTQIAKYACAPDYIQCLPANVEVRVNLWNMNGGSGSLAPDVAGLTNGTKVKAVIDDFSFVPSTVDHVPDGGTCSKHCQCSTESECGANGTCMPLVQQTNSPTA